MPQSRRYSRDKSLMHFKTRKWYVGDYSEAKAQRMDAAHTSRHQAIISKLPIDLRTLTTIDLNDANCTRFERNLATGSLNITLRAGDNRGLFDLELRYEHAILISRHNGIAAFLSHSGDEIAAGAESQILSRTARRVIMSGSTERAQVLYDEVDIMADGSYEHRMLLWPYGEILIRFAGFSLTRTPVAS